MRTELEKESKEWAAKPFSFSPSPAFGELLKNRQTLWANGSRKKPEAKACMCQHCGSVIVIGKERDSKRNVHPEVYCDKECAEADRSRVYRLRKIGDKTILSKGWMPTSMASKVVFCSCRHCKKRFAAAQPRHFCSEACRSAKGDAAKRAKDDEADRRRARKEAAAARVRSIATKRIDALNRIQEEAAAGRPTCACIECGALFIVKPGVKKIYCSRTCLNKRAGTYRQHVIRTSAVYSDSFTAREVFVKANWRCKQCRRRVYQGDPAWSDRQATIDHIVPVSKGGLHVWSNVQCLCRACNLKKSNKMDKPIQLSFL